jgi:pyridoxal phosphate enzyme (YggS family)
MTIADTIAALRQRVDKAQKNSPLSQGAVTLLAASKSQGADAVERAVAAGIADFGENRVQEAEAKWPALRARYPHLQLHLIGPLQTNKVRQALSLFDVIQTVDRVKLADAIADELAGPVFAATGRPRPRFFIQVNIGCEPQKAGVLPDEADALIGHCRARGLAPEGLMCIPPEGHPPAPYFALMRTIAERNGLKGLSMGMSDDFETAVRMGSGCVRLGRALFGGRPA